MRTSSVDLRAFPCTDHESKDVAPLEFCGIQFDLYAGAAERGDEPPHMPLYLCNCSRCHSTLSRYVSALLYDACEPCR